MSTVLNESIIDFANSLIPAIREKTGLTEDAYDIVMFYQSENSTFKVTKKATGEKMMLRVCEPGYHSFEEICGEIDFMNAIREYSDLSIPEPIKGINGEYVQRIEKEGNEYYSVMFTFVKGTSPEQDNLSELGEYYYKLGCVTAKMHKATIESGISERTSRGTWTPEKLFGEKAILGNYRTAKSFTEDDMRLFDKVEAKIYKRLEKYGKNSENYGLVHSDCRLANLLMDGDDISVIDFDDSGLCWFLNDYGSAFSFIEDSSYVPMLSKNWIKGYESIRELSEADKNELDTFILIRRFLLQGFLLSHTESEAVKDGIGDNYAEGTRQLAIRYLQNS